MHAVQFRFWRINNNHNTHMYIVCIKCLELGEEDGRKYVTEKDMQED